VVQHTDTVHVIKRSGAKWKPEDISLHHMDKRIPAVFFVGAIRGKAQVQPHDLRGRFVRDDLKVPSHAAAGLEEELGSQRSGRCSRAAVKVRAVLGVIGHAEPEPLKAEAPFRFGVERLEVPIRRSAIPEGLRILPKEVRIVLLDIGVEAWHAVDDGELNAASIAAENSLHDFDSVALGARANSAGSLFQVLRLPRTIRRAACPTIGRPVRGLGFEHGQIERRAAAEATGQKISKSVFQTSLVGAQMAQRILRC
jgi:hypothetical protein